MKKNRNVNDIVGWRLCSGCGVCAVACPENSIVMRDIQSEGLRPEAEVSACGECVECLKVCPGLGYKNPELKTDMDNEKYRSWGPVLKIYEGYAADPEIRYKGSSGGAVSALALYGIEQIGFAGAVQVSMDRENPWKNRTDLSKNRDDVLQSTGSRYSPASPGEYLDKLDEIEGKIVFTGKPCDIAGVRKYCDTDRDMKDRIGILLGIFCAGTPSSDATQNWINKIYEYGKEKISSLRYRGNGWPGYSVVESRDGYTYKQTYAECWGFLQRYRPYRCYLCPDTTSEMADISCGDPWYKENYSKDKGSSLIIARTSRGKEYLEKARESGYIVLKHIHSTALEESQKGMPKRRGAIWGRIQTMRFLGLPVPEYKGFSLYSNWLRLGFREKLRSFFGTLKRIIQRKYYKPGNR